MQRCTPVRRKVGGASKPTTGHNIRIPSRGYFARHSAYDRITVVVSQALRLSSYIFLDRLAVSLVSLNCSARIQHGNYASSPVSRKRRHSLRHNTCPVRPSEQTKLIFFLNPHQAC
jgi:hypothetical protein